MTQKVKETPVELIDLVEKLIDGNLGQVVRARLERRGWTEEAQVKRFVRELKASYISYVRDHAALYETDEVESFQTYVCFMIENSLM